MENKFNSVRKDLKNRFDDIDVMIGILCKEEKVNPQLLIKSSIILMIYNAVEGTFSNLLSDFFDFIVKKEIPLSKLPQRLQENILKYYINEINNNPTKLYNFHTLNEVELCRISYLDFCKYSNLFSGNLDSRQIRGVSQKLGVDLPNDLSSDSLLTVKKIRNELAHGEIKFSTASQDLVLDKLKCIRCDVEKYLLDLIQEYEKFFDRLDINNRTF